MTNEQPYRDFNPYTDRDPAEFAGPEPTALELIQAFAVRNIPLVSLAVPSYPIVIDVNHWVDVDLTLAKEKSNISGVIIKLTEGDGKAVKFKDPKADTYIRWARDLKLPLGVFHFFRQHWSGADQANWFLENAEQYRSLSNIKWIYPHLDRETTDGVSDQDLSNYRAYKCWTTVQREWSTPGFYTNLDNFNKLFHIGTKVVDWVNEVFWWWAQWTSALSPMWPAAIALARRGLWQNGISGSHTWIKPIEGARVVDHGYDLAGVTDIPDPEPPPDLADLIDQVEALKTQVTAMQSTLTATVTAANAADSRSRANAANIAATNSNVVNHGKQIGSLQTDIEAIYERLSKVEQRNVGQDNLLNGLVTRLDDLERTIEQVGRILAGQ